MTPEPRVSVELSVDLVWGADFDDRRTAAAAALTLAAMRIGVAAPRVYRTDMPERCMTRLAIVAETSINQEA